MDDFSNNGDIPDNFVTVLKFCFFVFVHITCRYLELVLIEKALVLEG